MFNRIIVAFVVATFVALALVPFALMLAVS